MNIKFLGIGAAAVAAASLWAPAAYAQAPESSDPIKIALFDWTSVNLNAKILGGVLEKLGYTVEYPTGDYLSSLTTSLTNGDVTVRIEAPDSRGFKETAQGRPRRRLFSGRGVDTDIVVASAKAYMQALNKALASKEDNNSSSSLNIAEGATKAAV